ncbi:MAG: xylulose kinase, partial [Anaerolineae bacterium]|nr:xylulose kinase [Anaerolineae bacterium]
CLPLDGAFLLEEALNAGTFIVSWFVENFGPDVSGLGLSLSPEEVLEAAASKLPPGAHGLLLVPYWKGVLSPYWDSQARGITIGWTGAHRKEHFYRAILEGIAFEHRLAMEAIGQVSGQPAEEFILMGGGSRSPLWCQIIADVTGKRATRAGTTEASALGAGILAAAAVGWYANAREAANAMTSTGRTFQPLEAAHLVYERLFNEVYRGLFPVVQQFVDRLTELSEHQDSAGVAKREGVE